MARTLHDVVVKRDAYGAYCPALESFEASTEGETREEALTHIHSRLFMIIAHILAQRTAIPIVVEVYYGTKISVEV